MADMLDVQMFVYLMSLLQIIEDDISLEFNNVYSICLMKRVISQNPCVLLVINMSKLQQGLCGDSIPDLDDQNKMRIKIEEGFVISEFPK
jgi:hypothetical protein